MEADPGRREPLFRPEALEHRARQRGPGDVIRVAPRWTGAAFYALLALFSGALIAGLTIEIDRYALGTTATDDRGRLVLLLPAALAPQVVTGDPVELGDRNAEVVDPGGDVLYPTQVKARYGIDVEGPSVVVVTSAEGAGEGGTARVLVAREPVILAFVPGLGGLVGR